MPVTNPFQVRHTEIISASSDLALSLATIPTETDLLILRGDNLGSKPLGDLVHLMQTITAQLKSLNLGFNNLGELLEGLSTLFTVLPDSLKSLSLTHNNLWKLNGNALALSFAKVNENISSLNLASNDLGSKTSNEIIQLLSVIRTVSTLNLSFNKLNKLPCNELSLVIASVPPSVRKLILNGNDLCGKPIAEITQVLASIPPTVISLGFNDLDLLFLTNADQASILSAIPITVTSLALGIMWSEENDTPIDIVSLIRLIPANISALGLMSNHLDFFDNEELINILCALPQTVSSLDLTGNNFDARNDDELIAIVKGIPLHIIAVDFDKNSRIENVFLQIRAQIKLKSAMKLYPGDSNSNCNLDTQMAYQLYSEISELAIKEYAEAQFWMAKLICFHSNLSPEDFNNETGVEREMRLSAMQPHLEAAAKAGHELAEFEKVRLDLELQNLNVKFVRSPTLFSQSVPNVPSLIMGSPPNIFQPK
jgi:hypothetical protein